jgi:3-methylcrotonyl-CoA carboxylase beta subunit
VDDLAAQVPSAAAGGGQVKPPAPSTWRGKLLPRDRVQMLLDPGTPFLEIAPLAALNMYNNDAPWAPAGVIAGIGRVSGVDCMIVCNDATVKGGTYYPLTVKKHLRAQEIASRTTCPASTWWTPAGANLPNQDEVFPDRDHFRPHLLQPGQHERAGHCADRGGHGQCTAGGAYVPAMSDETIIVKNQGTIFLGGPPLVKAATGEVVSAEDLGGGDVHTRLSGVADHLAQNDLHALALARQAVATLNKKPQPPCSCKSRARPSYRQSRAVRRDPHRHAQTLRRARDHCPHRRRQPNSMSSRQRFGTTLVCGFAHIEGMPVGIIANNGILFSESAQKGAHFIELCCQRKIPLVFLQNITGFMVGASTKTKALPATAPRWSRRWPRPACPSSPSSSAAALAPATTACAAAPTARASCGCGPTRASA